MDPAAIQAACGALEKELRAQGETQRANALRDTLANRMNPADTVSNLRFVMRRILDGRPELLPAMHGKVEAIMAEIESLSKNSRA